MVEMGLEAGCFGADGGVLDVGEVVRVIFAAFALWHGCGCRVLMCLDAVKVMAWCSMLGSGCSETF